MHPYPQLTLPKSVNAILLHACCAPCSGEIIAALQASAIQFTLFFYNPNIHPRKEYEIRKNENKRFADQHHIPFIDADYDKADWLARTQGLEHEPERGQRCTICFDMRLERAALYAYKQGFEIFTSSLGISRWKNMQQVNSCGKRAAQPYPNLIYWDYNWRKKGGSQRMVEIAKANRFYRQEYCGCVYSLRDMNQWRQEKGLPPVALLSGYYGEAQ